MFDNRQLAALLQIARTGSFEQAARALHITQSAVSQRIRLLEERVGATLLVRGSPCRTTDLGARLCRHAETVELMELSLEAELTAVSKETARPTFKLAINADSLATWFIEAMASVEAVLFDLVLDDEGHSADWLKQGEGDGGRYRAQGTRGRLQCLRTGRHPLLRNGKPRLRFAPFPGRFHSAGCDEGTLRQFQPQGPSAGTLRANGSFM